MDIQVNPEFEDLLEYAGVDGALFALKEMEAEGPRLIGLIDVGGKSGNLSAVAEAAHSLKSSCAALSMNASAELAKTIETAARSGGGVVLADTAVELRTLFDQELAAIRNFVERRAGNGASR
ncbi:Hpt domain-containing protein [Hwanghaeella grinnelliae]|uniref:Hpt domain-containing protein n=1 Tax=Hwanghaeella grinnelliae TaxID=2500179 RepID=A0A3S2ZAF5_9PROT|nr:Hpt domain-containing protein [Hwanghaeella grinnelliae]RVU38085.1 Hpt domain-containing protein [Hwanghaeella grinnelliae]